MVSGNRKIPGTGAIKPLNSPEPVFVEEDPSCSPVAVKLKQRHRIIAIDDYWRIDDEWWRTESISRMYFAIRLDSGRKMILYKDLIGKKWYQQTY